MANKPSSRKQDVTVWYVFAAIAGMLLLQWVWTSYAQIETIPFSQFQQLVSQDKVAEVAVGQDSIQGTLKDPLPGAGRSLSPPVWTLNSLTDSPRTTSRSWVCQPAVGCKRYYPGCCPPLSST